MATRTMSGIDVWSTTNGRFGNDDIRQKVPAEELVKRVYLAMQIFEKNTK